MLANALGEVFGGSPRPRAAALLARRTWGSGRRRASASPPARFLPKESVREGLYRGPGDDEGDGIQRERERGRRRHPADGTQEPQDAVAREKAGARSVVPEPRLHGSDRLRR